jgi:hypothetical protein
VELEAGFGARFGFGADEAVDDAFGVELEAAALVEDERAPFVAFGASPAAPAGVARARPMAVPSHKGAHFLSMRTSSHASATRSNFWPKESP